MKVKAFEIRDRHTFIPALGVLMVPGGRDVTCLEAVAEQFLLGRAGYGEEPLVLLVRMNAKGCSREAAYDPYDWGVNPRTFCVAHQHIAQHWDELESGAVICVEHILGERETPKVSERLA